MRYLLLLCWLGSAPLLAQTTAETRVAQAVTAWRAATLAADTKALAPLLAEELNYGHSNGLVEDRAMVLDGFATGKAQYLRMDISDQTIRVTGKVALVRHNVVADIRDSGKAMTLSLMVLQVWRKKAGQWQLLARQAARRG